MIKTLDTVEGRRIEVEAFASAHEVYAIRERNGRPGWVLTMSRHIALRVFAPELLT